MSENLSELLGRRGLYTNFFDELGNLARPAGTPDEAELARLAEAFLIGRSNAFGTASFYDFLKPENKGKQVYVCNGTACECAGTQPRVLDRLRAEFREDEIGHMTCLGRCHENAAFHFRGRNYSGTDIENLERLMQDGSALPSDRYAVEAGGQAILTRPFQG